MENGPPATWAPVMWITPSVGEKLCELCMNCGMSYNMFLICYEMLCGFAHAGLAVPYTKHTESLR